MLSYIEIWNIKSNSHFQTKSEEVASADTARQQFVGLMEVISRLENPTSSICLETTTGLMAFPQKFLSDSLFRLKIEE